MGEGASVRMNISLPGTLKREMDDNQDAVNWSNVAAEAFRLKLLELRSSRKGKNMDEVIKRLQAAAELEANEEHEDGEEAGKRWAMDDARPSQLRRLDEAVDQAFSAESLCGAESDAFGCAGAVRHMIDGGFEDRADLDSFWAEVLGDDEARIYDRSFAIGFVEGAIKVWKQVKSRL